VTTLSRVIRHKYDFRVLRRLISHLREMRFDAVVTVETGDAMFWGRLAARLAGVPVICSALHTTGYPNRIERLNRLLAPVTDAFIAVAGPHGRYLVDDGGCPAHKVRVIPNGVDVDRFHPRWPDSPLQQELGITPGTPVVGVVAALRPEKNLELFVEAAALIRLQVPDARFVIVGDGPERASIEGRIAELSLDGAVHLLGSRDDVPEVLSLFDVFLLSSRMEANPVSLLEAMASEVPVVAPRVGSIPETVEDGKSGMLVEPGDAQAMAGKVLGLLSDRRRAEAMGRAGREQVIARSSVERMVEGYEGLIEEIYRAKSGETPVGQPAAVATPADAPREHVDVTA
jgi:glycosyltransferase involved in cell wall biosynthesis